MKINRITPIALMTVLFVLAATLLTACGSTTPPEYGQVITETPMPATATPEATALPEITLAPTQRPDAKDAALAWTKADMTYDAKEAGTAVIDRICALAASEYGCWKVQAWNRTDLYARYPNAKSQPVIKSVRKVLAGVMSDGVEYEVWMVEGEHSNPWKPGQKTFTSYPTFVWSAERGRWEYFYSPDSWTARSLKECGQFVEYAPDGHAYNSEAEWKKVYAQCQTATPLPPTPFVPVTPVFTPKP